MAAKYTGVEKYIFADVYTLFLKYVNIPDEDYYWQSCLQDAKMICFKYKDYPLAKRMVTNVLEQLEFKVCNRAIDDMTYKEWDTYLGDYKNKTPFNINSSNNRL